MPAATSKLGDGSLDDYWKATHYNTGLSFADLIDVTYYNTEHKFFETRDLRFGRVYRLPLINGENMAGESKLAISNALARVMSCFPVGSTGQVIRYSYSDIRPDVMGWMDRLKNKTGIWQVLRDSIAGMQLRGARNGFLSMVDPKSIERAERAELNALRNGVSEQEEAEQIEADYSQADRVRGAYAFHHDTYLVFGMMTKMAEDGLLTSIGRRLLSGVSMKAALALTERQYKVEVDRFKFVCERIEKTLHDEGFGVQPLDGQGLMNAMYRELNPSRYLTAGVPTMGEDAGVTIPDRLCMSPLQTEKNGWVIDGVHYRVVSAKGMPEETRPGMLMYALEQVESEGWSVVNFNVPAQGPIRLAMKVRQSVLSAKADSTNPLLKPDPIKMAKDQGDLDLVQNAMNPDEVHTSLAVNTSVHIVVKDRDKTRADMKARRLEDLLWKQGYAERLRGDAVIHSLLPFNCRPSGMKLIRRSFPVLSENVADLAPLYNGYAGMEDGGLLLNNGFGVPIRWDFFTKEVTAPHGLLVGGTGTGKTFLIVNVLQQERMANDPKVFLIDKGGGYESICRAQNGEYIHLVPQAQDGHKPRCINPLHLDEKEDEARQPTPEELEAMRTVIVAMIQSGTGDAKGNSEAVTKETRAEILRILKDLFAARPRGQQYILSDFCAAALRTGSETLAKMLYEYTKEGIYGQMFDGPLDVDWSNDFIVVDIAPMGNSPALDVVMLVLFRQIEGYCKYKLPRDRKKMIMVDEAWAVLARPELARQLGGYYRELRKYGTSVTLISQTFNDFIKLVTAEGQSDDGVFANTRHFIFLGHNRMDIDQAKAKLGVTDEDSMAWRGTRSLPPYFSEFFYVQIAKNSSTRCGVVRLYSNPVGLWIASSDPNDYGARERLTKKLIEEKGMSTNAARIAAVIALAKEYPYGISYAR